MAWTLAGNLVYAGCQWAMLVVLAKLGTPAMVGQFALALALTAPVLLFTNLQLRQIQATDARHEYPFGEYLGLRLAMTGLGVLIILVLALIGGYESEMAWIILIVGLAKAFESISDVFYGLLQQRDRMDRMAISMMIKGVLSLMALGLGVYLTHSVLWGVVGLACIWALILVSYDLRSGSSVLRMASHPDTPAPTWAVPMPIWQPAKLLRLAWLALPLGVTMMLISLNINIPRYLTEHFLGRADLGIFAAISYTVVAGTTVFSAVGQSVSPHLARYHAGDHKGGFWVLFGKLLAVGLALGFAGVLLALVAGREILTLLYSPEYGARSDIFMCVMLAAALGYVYSALGYAATASRKIGHQPLALLVIVLTSLLSGYILIPTYGLLGAATTTVISSAVSVLAYAILLTWNRKRQ